MLFRRLGRTGLKVSELGLGVARGAKDDRQNLIATIHAAVDSGINFVDTANRYEDGLCESAVGEALQGRSDVLVCSKYLPYDGWDGQSRFTGSRAGLIAAVEQSLRRLRRDHLDVLLGHAVRTTGSFEQFMHQGCYEAMLDLRKQGKVRWIGISELSEADGTHEVLKRVVATNAFDVVMVTLNILLQTAAETVLPLCQRHDVGVLVMEALNQPGPDSGLTGLPGALESIRRCVANGLVPNAPPYTDPGILDILQPYTVPEAALRYVLAHPQVGCCLFGSRSPERVARNLRALDPPYLDAARMARLHELFGRIGWQIR